MTEKLHATAVRAPDHKIGRATPAPMMWLFVTHTRVVDAIDIPDRYLIGRYLTPGLSKRGKIEIDPTTQTFTYIDHIDSVPRDMVLFANVRMQSEGNDVFKLADQSQWGSIVNTWSP
jgi:hypothetical protein